MAARPNEAQDPMSYNLDYMRRPKFCGNNKLVLPPGECDNNSLFIIATLAFSYSC